MGKLMIWVLIAAIILAAPILLFGVLTALDSESNFTLLFKTEPPLASGVHRVLAVAIWIAVSMLIIAYWQNARAMTKELEVRLAFEELQSQAEENHHPPTIVSDGPDDAKAQALSYYNKLGYELITAFEGYDGEKIEVLARTPDDRFEGIWRREGVHIYPSGESVKFSVGVLYGSDSWQFDSERLIQRQHIGRAVRIETAMNRPLLKILSDKNDYLLCLGLSSTRDGDSSDQRDEKLAVARAYNLGHAATRLKWKTEDRVFGLTIGKAKTAPSIPELEPLQRSAVIVGVNASRDVVARDVVISAASIISLNGVDLSQYSRPLANPSKIRDIKFQGGYLEASKVQFRRETGAPAPLLILKAIPEQ